MSQSVADGTRLAPTVDRAQGYRLVAMIIPLASRMDRVKPSAIRELLRLGADPAIINFGGGYPDASLFPLHQLDAVFSRAITEHGSESLQYTVSTGTPHLCDQIARRMQRDGVSCTGDDILILQGGQQGLDLVAKMLVNKGDVIVTEDPTFLGGLIAFNPCEPTYACVPLDAEGMDTEALERTLRANPGAKFIYTIPDFQNPAGVTMSLARRKHLIELANRFDVMVLEDSPYREIRFEGTTLPTLKSLDTEGRVIYLGTFSKILAPGLRLGWAVASPDVIHHLALAETCGRHAMQHVEHGRRLAVSRHLRHREPHPDDPADLPTQEERDVGNHAGALPRRDHLHQSARWHVHVADVPRRVRQRALHARSCAAAGEGRICSRSHLLSTRQQAEPCRG